MLYAKADVTRFEVETLSPANICVVNKIVIKIPFKFNISSHPPLSRSVSETQVKSFIHGRKSQTLQCATTKQKKQA